MILLLACTETATTEPPADARFALTAGAPGGSLLAWIDADADAGDFPLVVSFDPGGSSLGSGSVRYDWSFGDGAGAVDAGEVVHTYVGEGSFVASLTLTDEVTGDVSVSELTIEVSTPDCPDEGSPEDLGTLEDDEVDELSGIAVSRLDPTVYWVHEDGDESDRLLAVDAEGAVLSEQGLPDEIDDLEDISAVVDPQTGTPTLFLADTGDNDEERDNAAVWVVAEPDPWIDGELVPLRMELTYPDGPVDAESLLVDPLTMDLYLLTKESDEARVYVKRAPHDDEGPFEVEALGTWSSLDFMASGGDVSADGTRVVVRGYSSHARVWMRDGYLPLEAAFDEDPCTVDIRSEEQGEGVAFTADGAGLVTVSEGEDPSVSYVEL